MSTPVEKLPDLSAFATSAPPMASLIPKPSRSASSRRSLLPRPPSPVQDKVRELARMVAIDDDIFDDYTSVVNFESGGRHRRRDGSVQIGAVNRNTPERAVGAAQALPSTIQQYRHPITGKRLNPYDEVENLLGGLMYFSEGHSKSKAAGRDAKVGARIFYFGGPGRNENSGWRLYARTGRIPRGQDANGTTFQQYVSRTGGNQRPTTRTLALPAPSGGDGLPDLSAFATSAPDALPLPSPAVPADGVGESDGLPDLSAFASSGETPADDLPDLSAFARESVSSNVVDDAEITPDEFTPVQFKPYDARELSVTARAAVGAAQLAARPSDDLAPDHPDRVGQAVTVRIKAPKTHPVSQSEILDAALRQLGAGDVGRRYREEIGRDIGNVGDISTRYDRRTGEHVAEFKPSLGFVRLVNAYGRGGAVEASAEFDRIERERAAPEPVPVADDKPQTARNTLADIGVSSAQTGSNVLTGIDAMQTALRYGTHSPEYDELLAEDKKNQRVITGARESIPEEKTMTRRIVRGIATGVLNPSNYMLGLSPGGFLTAHAIAHGHEGTANVRRGLIQTAPALAVGGAVGELAGASSLPVRAGAQALTGGGVNAATASAGGERDPSKLAEQFGIGAGMGLLMPGGRHGEVVGIEPLSITGRGGRAGEHFKITARDVESGQVSELVFDGETGKVVVATAPRSASAASSDAPVRILTREPLRPLGGLPRTVVVVELADGTRQPFYRSSGTNSKRAGEWFPFSKIDNPDSPRAWFDKDAYNEGDIAERDHPLHRYGTPELQRVGQWLGTQNIPAGRGVSHGEINAHIAEMVGAGRPTSSPVATESSAPASRDITELGASLVEAGAVDFPTWSRRLLDEVGESVPLGTPEQLDELYARSRESAGVAPESDDGVPAGAGRASLPVRAGRVVSSTLSLPKALRASIDWSMVGRQGLPQVLAHPTFLKKVMVEQAKATVSQAEFDRFAQSVRDHPDFALMVESGLDLATTGKMREEPFASRAASHILGVKQSERAYKAAADSLRVQAWDYYTKRVAGRANTTPETYRAVADLINISTGRGRVPVLDRYDWGRAVVNALNVPFFSPRTTAARFNVISPARIVRNYANPATRKVAYMQLLDAARGTVTLGTTLALVNLIPGVDVGFDPRESSFGKIRIGRRVYDVTGGMSNTARYMTNMFRAFAGMKQGDKPEDNKTAVELTLRFLRSQLSPSASVAVDAWTGETFDKKEFSKLQAAADLTAPMVAADLYEAWKMVGGSTVSEVARSVESGDARGLHTGFSGLPFAAPTALGAGFQIYNDKPPDRTPLPPVLSPRVQGELTRLKVGFDHLGKKDTRTVAVKPNYKLESVTGDSIKVFKEGEGTGIAENGSLGLSAAETAAQNSRVLDAALSKLMESEDYRERSDKGKRQAIEQVLLNAHKRVLNPVRVRGRAVERGELKRIREWQDRLERGEHLKGNK